MSPTQKSKALVYGGVAVCLLICAALTIRQIYAPPSAYAHYVSNVEPIVATYCFECHDEDVSKGELVLDCFTNLNSMLIDREMWEHVSFNLGNHLMPPIHKPQPTPEERAVVLAWIEANVFLSDCDTPKPGHVALRRLNREEYNNTVFDLVGVQFRPADDFPADDSGYGFDNIADVLTLSPTLLDRYLSAAEDILALALDTAPATSGVFVAGPSEFKGMNRGRLHSHGEVYVDYAVPMTGEYRVRARASANQAGPDLARMEMRIQGLPARTFDIEGHQEERWYEQSVILEAGTHRVSTAFVNDYYESTHADPRQRDRNLSIHTIQILGPLNLPPPEPSLAYKRIMTCTPDPQEDPRPCLTTVVQRFADRAYRRPVVADELARLVDLAADAMQAGASFEDSLRTPLLAVLVSPRFLFRIEPRPDAVAAGEVYALDEYALASRLSYFLWSSMPDAELFDLAACGELRAQLGPQVERMLQDPRAHALTRNFCGQWLQLRNLAFSEPDMDRFPAFNEALRASMVRETEALFEHVVCDDLSVVALLEADYSFMDEALARHYGITNVVGPSFRKVSLQDTPRAGLLTHASILTLTSNPTRTSPVKRGKWILEALLGAPPPPPQADTPDLDQETVTDRSLSMRARLEQHREAKECATCHALMDPLGFGLEHFDPIGAWRTHDGAFEADATGTLVTGEAFEGARELTDILNVRHRKDFVMSMTRALLTYGLGRGLGIDDRCALESIYRTAEFEDFRFSCLIQAIVQSVPFQMQQERLATDSYLLSRKN